MEKISTATRIHPLMAAAALSVITVCVAGTAAITGLLPSSQAHVAAQTSAAVTPEMQLAQAQQLLAAQQLAAQPQPLLNQQASLAPVANTQQLAPLVDDEPAPVVKHKVHARPKVHTQRVVYREPARHAPRYDSSQDYRVAAPAPVQRKPNYVGIGTGAVIGGLIGNQVGGGNGRKLATLAGIIGGGYVGNEVANRNQR